MSRVIRFTEAQWQALLSGLWLRSDVETGAIVFTEAMPGAASPSLAVRRVVHPPADAYRAREPDFLEIDPIWMNRQCFEARKAGYSVFTAHTHLSERPAWFSWADDTGDRRLMPALVAQMPDQIHGSINITHTDALARAYVDGSFMPARISVCGAGLQLLPNPELTDAGRETHVRQELALGRRGQARLTATRVGIVGLGGTGSLVAALLGRLGLRRFVLVDGDHLEASNFSRVLESRPADLEERTLKTTIAKRALHAIVPDATIVTIAQPLARLDQLDALASCDVVFSCVDRLAPRGLLNSLAYGAHIPVVDMGSAFRVDDTGQLISQGGKVVVIGPGRPCLWCWGDLDAERIRVESLEPEERRREAEHGYVTGADEPQPSVVSFNTTLAAAAVTEFVRMVTSFAGSASPPDRINFDFEMGTATRARGRSAPDCRFCGIKREEAGTAAQQRPASGPL